jgi:uncharacterized protein DUF4439
VTALVDAWQAALAAEQRAAFGYTVLGPRLPAGRQHLAGVCQSQHETMRNAVTEELTARGDTPQAPAGDYPDLYPLAAHPQKLAASLEDECAAAWRYLFAVASDVAATGELRREAQAELTACAIRAVRWRSHLGPKLAVQAFPGM